MNYQMVLKHCALIISLFAAFELHILKRPDAEKAYNQEEQVAARTYYDKMSEQDITQLTRNIIAGLPGAEEGYTLDEFQTQLDRYKDISPENSVRIWLIF